MSGGPGLVAQYGDRLRRFLFTRARNAADVPDLAPEVFRIEAAWKAGNNHDYTLRELPRLNHLFQSARTGDPTKSDQVRTRG